MLHSTIIKYNLNAGVGTIMAHFLPPQPPNQHQSYQPHALHPVLPLTLRDLGHRKGQHIATSILLPHHLGPSLPQYLSK